MDISSYMCTDSERLSNGDIAGKKEQERKIRFYRKDRIILGGGHRANWMEG